MTPRMDRAWDSGVCGGAVCICSRTAPFPPYPSPVRHGCASKPNDGDVLATLPWVALTKVEAPALVHPLVHGWSETTKPAP